MKKLAFAALAMLLCTAATASPSYVFDDRWDDNKNNDVVNPNTNLPYTKNEIKEFLESKEDRRGVEIGSQALGKCGYIVVEKGCHQANDKHVTIYADPRNRSNQTNACKDVRKRSDTFHVNGCGI